MILLQKEFYCRDVLQVAPELLGKMLVTPGYTAYITEVEAYRGEEDLACHASKGRTTRTEIMYHDGGYIYVYLIYGMYWMLNIVCGEKDSPQAVLIRGIEGFDGPGKLTKKLNIDKSYYGKHICHSSEIGIYDTGKHPEILASSRIGINYAGEPWISQPWRYLIKN